MNTKVDAIAAPAVGRARVADFLQLTKPRLTLLVLGTTITGFYLGAYASVSLVLLGQTLLATALVAGGASALNMWLERELDARMQRTRLRPLPAGRLQAAEVLIFAISISVAGLTCMLLWVNGVACLLAAVTLLSYLFVYTPLKTRTWRCTLAGAVAGAIPPMIGWAAVRGEVSLGAWVLFAILFLWQLPHFFAIAWIYREDYAQAGFSMLSVIDETGSRTSKQVRLYILALIVVTLIPSLVGLAGLLYLIGAIGLGLSFLAFGLVFARLRDRLSARRLFVVSICYLPFLLILLMVDKVAP